LQLIKLISLLGARSDPFETVLVHFIKLALLEIRLGESFGVSGVSDFRVDYLGFILWEMGRHTEIGRGEVAARGGVPFILGKNGVGIFTDSVHVIAPLLA
jgi:hypothetical protein